SRLSCSSRCLSFVPLASSFFLPPPPPRSTLFPYTTLFRSLEVVPGAVSAPSGEVPVDLSPLHCGAALRPLGEGDDLTVRVADPTTRVSAHVPEDELGVSVTAEVTVTSPDLGTRALFQGVVLSDPRTGAVVAGARNAPTSALQWIGEEGVTRTGRAW